MGRHVALLEHIIMINANRSSRATRLHVEYEHRLVGINHDDVFE
jgi:hypothetical protein